jgi:hypothetical protein
MKKRARLFVSLVFSCVLAATVAAAEPPLTNSIAPQMVPSRSKLTRGGVLPTPERKASPPFSGISLPDSPRQGAAWTWTATNLPANYVSATRALFEQGLADPRDCEYREIEVGTGSAWQGDGGVVTTHGWVLPGRKSQRFAICWNGLVYPAVSLGAKADLAADGANLVTNGSRPWYPAIPEGMSVSPVSSLGVKGCLLLRLGRGDLAAGFWQSQIRRAQDVQNALNSQFHFTNAPSTNGAPAWPDTDPYLEWANDWAWAMFDRMICAHERGDQALALVTARQLAKAQPKIEAECAKRGFKRQPNWDSSKQGQLIPYLSFLEQLPQILADLERREKERRRLSTDQAALRMITNQSERISALIRNLELVQARQWRQPGGVDLNDDPVTAALIQEGDAAVDPLLDCLERDKRLTRSVRFGRDFHVGRTVLPVADAARRVLESILQTDFRGGAPEIRAYWNKYKGMKLEDRWYAILQDDAANSRWLEAAGNIIRPGNLRAFSGRFATDKSTSTKAPIPVQGEILRGKTNPSITELMTRRALEIPQGNPGSYDLSAACQMGLDLAAWDAAAAKLVDETLVKRACTVMKYSDTRLGLFVAKLSLACADAGDFQPFQEYAAWLKTTRPEQLDYSLMDCLQPIRKFPTNEVLLAAAESVFDNTNSPWAKLPWRSAGLDNPEESDLVHVPAFRVLLSRELEKTNACGSFTWHEPNMLEYQITNYQGGSRMAGAFEGAHPVQGTTSELRWCDWIAWCLSNAKQIPFFNPFAPVEKRDEEIASAKALLKPRY